MKRRRFIASTLAATALPAIAARAAERTYRVGWVTASPPEGAKIGAMPMFDPEGAAGPVARTITPSPDRHRSRTQAIAARPEPVTSGSPL